MKAGDSRPYLFGKFRVEPLLNTVTCGDATHHLEPKTMDVLVCLLDRAGAVVSIDELLACVWPGRVVEPSAVHQRMSKLRRCFNDSTRQPRYIGNVARRGYRTIAQVIRIVGTVPTVGTVGTVDSSSDDASSASATTRERLAILQLRDLSAEQNLGWLADGLTEQLRHQIAVWRRFQVLPGALLRGTALDTAEPAADLMIDGYLQRSGRKVVVSLDMIDVATRTTRWSEAFHGEDEEPYELQRHIGASVARFFGQTVVGAAPAPRNARAYRPYLKFAHHKTFGDADEEIYWLERTLAIDAGWSAGWASLALAYCRQLGYTRDLGWLDKARTALQRAKDTSDRLGDWWSIAAYLNMLMEGDLNAAEEMARVAIEKAGYVHTYALLMVSSGLYREAEALLRHATEQLPHDPTGWEYLAMARANLGDAEGTVDAGLHLARLWPEDALLAKYPMTWALPHAGRFDLARRLLRDLQQAIDGLKSGKLHRTMLEDLKIKLAFEMHALTGDYRAASAAVDSTPNASPALMGMLYLRLNDPRAEAYLVRAAKQPVCERFLWFQRTAHLSKPLRSHPLILQLEHALGFDRVWRYELAKRAATLPLDIHLVVDPEHYANGAAI